MGIIQICMHCGFRCSGKFCNNCDKKEKRLEMDKHNKSVIPGFECKMCDLGWYSIYSRTNTQQEIKDVA